MPILFALPKAVPLSSLGGIMPGAKLHFFQTGTSNPQPVYTDIGLTVAHSQPVVADGAGVFAPIYLDGTLSNYRVRLTDSSDVQIWQLDDVPASLTTAQNLRLKSTAPEIIFEETDAASGNKKSRLRVNAQVLTLDLLNDNEDTATEILRVPRSGMNLGTILLGGVTPLSGHAAYKGVQTQKFSSALESDNNLTLSLLGNVQYQIEGLLEFDAATSGGMGAKFALSYSGTLFHMSKANLAQFINGTGAVALAAMTVASPLAFATIGTSASSDQVRFSLGMHTTTAGTLALQWAQNSTTLSALTLRQGSWIRAIRIL